MTPSTVEPAAWSIAGSTGLLAVLGDPVRHSLSPTMHNAALRALGLDWVYLALPVPAAELATVVRALEAIDCRGVSVTLPHKQAVGGLARELSPLAARLGAVNTLVRREGGGWFGTNTDVEGFLAPLRQERPGERGGRAVVLGCGGSARAVLAGLLELELAEIVLVGRDPGRLQELLDDAAVWQRQAGAGGPQLRGLAWDGGGALPEALADCRLLVNTTPVGMASARDPQAAERSPLTATELERLPADATVYDLIYTPRPTALLRQAGLRGCRVLDGLEMLVQQGAAALRLWSGREDVPVECMRQAALARLAAG